MTNASDLFSPGIYSTNGKRDVIFRLIGPQVVSKVMTDISTKTREILGSNLCQAAFPDAPEWSVTHLAETRVRSVVLPVEEERGGGQDEVLDQHKEEEQGLHHERRILGFLVFRLRIPALLLHLETFLDGDDADVDQAVGEDVDDRHLP